MRLKPAEVIKDVNLPSYWRSYIGSHLDICAIQIILARYWNKEMDHTYISNEDATCYESRISYLTPVKLVWESCHNGFLTHSI